MSAVLGRPGNVNPTEIARDVIRQLAMRRILPTPDNYASLYAEISGNDNEHPAAQLLKGLAVALTRDLATAGLARSMLAALKKQSWTDVEAELNHLVAMTKSSGQSWGDLVRSLMRQWDARQAGLTMNQKRMLLEQTVSGADDQKLHLRLSSLVKSWSEATRAPLPMPEVEAMVPEPARVDAGAAAQFRELLAQTLELAVVERMGYTPDLAQHAKRLVTACREAASVKDVARLSQDLRKFWVRLELRGETVDEITRGLLTLLRILIGNLRELAGEDAWMKAQMERAQTLLVEPIEVGALREAEKGFREVAVRQGVIRHSLDEAKAALKGMVSMFIDRLGTMTAKTGDFQKTIGHYADQIEDADDLNQLSTVLSGLLSETRGVQADMQRTRDELDRTRQEAQEREERVRHLERELEVTTNLVKVDPLTSVLNRRGLNDAYAVEDARCTRAGLPMCVALLDIDNFKRLNDTMGHQAGDEALRHLAAIIRETIRPSDTVARFGGEEFVLLLPDTPMDEAEKVMTRVQRELTKRLFLHNNERVLITFSAGVAERRLGEARDDHIGRADAAMYEAKGAGKNRVCRAA